MEKKNKKQKIFAFKNCDNCNKGMKRSRIFKGKVLCFSCYQKEITLIPTVTYKFNEPLSVQKNIALDLTKKQSNLLQERLKYIFPNKKLVLGVKSGLGIYARELILTDLDLFNKFIKTKNEKN